MLTQLHVVKSIDKVYGGEGLAALRYAESLSDNQCKVYLLSTTSNKIIDNNLPSNNNFTKLYLVNSNYSITSFFLHYKYIFKLFNQINFDLIHLHGVWSPILVITAILGLIRGIPLIISPHGCLEPWALQYKFFKKFFSLKIYQNFILKKAKLIISTSNNEFINLRRFGLNNPIAVIPNGVDLLNSEASFNKSFQCKTFLFLSRLHPVKGLFDLVEAWALVRQDGWKILIAGGDQNNFRLKVENLIRQKNLECDFEFLGFVEEESKKLCFQRADIFILPTYSENFGIVIAEALSNGLPVITTKAAPWSDLIDYKCGWWVEPGVVGISSAIVEAMACKSDELSLMGQRGRRLVLKKYDWKKIGVTAREVSEWALDCTKKKPIVVDVVRYKFSNK
jgi:glycosyltransferase involved in cell wall biosynthesis